MVRSRTSPRTKNKKIKSQSASQQREIQQLWKALQNKEKELKNKSRKTSQEKKYLTELTAFLNNNCLNSETGYLESKWDQRISYIACGPEVINK